MSTFMIGIVLLLVTTLTGSLGALAFKHAMNKIKKVNLLNVVQSLWVWIGLLFYVLSAITNIQLLKYLDYSIAFPMTALTYVWTVAISYFLFNEKITGRKVIAIAFILVGIIIISR